MPSLNDYISAERANRYKAAAMKKRETARVNPEEDRKSTRLNSSHRL